MALFDFAGRPIKTAVLRSEVAGPQVGLRNLHQAFRALSELSLSALGAILRGAEAGETRDLQTLAGTMERRDLHIQSVLQTRRLAVIQAPWIVTPADDSPAAEEHAELLTRVTELDSFSDMLWTLTDAVYRGFAVSEILWEMTDSTWLPGQFKERDQRWFKWHRETAELRLRDNSEFGAELDPGKFLVHCGQSSAGRPQLAGLMYPLSVYFLYKQFSLRDWLAYAEVFGMPVRVGKHDSSATEEDIRTLQDAVKQIGSDAGAVIPETMQLEFMNANAGNSGGGALFENLLRWSNAEISKGALGQTMTVEDGSSEAQAQVHENVRFDILRADVIRLAQTLKQQLVRPVIDLNFGPQDAYPSLAASIQEPEDTVARVNTVVPFLDRGLPVRTEDLYKLIGMQPPEEDDEVLEVTTLAAEPATEPPPEELE